MCFFFVFFFSLINRWGVVRKETYLFFYLRCFFSSLVFIGICGEMHACIHVMHAMYMMHVMSLNEKMTLMFHKAIEKICVWERKKNPQAGLEKLDYYNGVQYNCVF